AAGLSIGAGAWLAWGTLAAGLSMGAGLWLAWGTPAAGFNMGAGAWLPWGTLVAAPGMGTAVWLVGGVVSTGLRGLRVPTGGWTFRGAPPPGPAKNDCLCVALTGLCPGPEAMTDFSTWARWTPASRMCCAATRCCACCAAVTVVSWPWLPASWLI